MLSRGLLSLRLVSTNKSFSWPYAMLSIPRFPAPVSPFFPSTALMLCQFAFTDSIFILYFVFGHEASLMNKYVHGYEAEAAWSSSCCTHVQSRGSRYQQFPNHYFQPLGLSHRHWFDESIIRLPSATHASETYRLETKILLGLEGKSVTKLLTFFALKKFQLIENSLSISDLKKFCRVEKKRAGFLRFSALSRKCDFFSGAVHNLI